MKSTFNSVSFWNEACSKVPPLPGTDAYWEALENQAMRCLEEVLEIQEAIVNRDVNNLIKEGCDLDVVTCGFNYLAGADYVSYCGLSRAAEQLNLIGEDVGFATVRSKDELKLSTGVTGANFHKLRVDDPKAAEAYLINDLALTRALANRILC